MKDDINKVIKKEDLTRQTTCTYDKKIIIPPLSSNKHSYKKYIKTDLSKNQTEKVKADLINLQIQKNKNSKISNKPDFISNKIKIKNNLVTDIVAGSNKPSEYERFYHSHRGHIFLSPTEKMTKTEPSKKVSQAKTHRVNGYMDSKQVREGLFLAEKIRSISIGNKVTQNDCNILNNTINESNSNRKPKNRRRSVYLLVGKTGFYA